MAFSTWRTPGADVPRMRFAAAPLAGLEGRDRHEDINL
jgi:hypothetical protein